MTSTKTITVGSFPYAPAFNPYQRLITESIESAGGIVSRIPPIKWFPLQNAVATECDILHLDWPHDWYNGKNVITRFLKTHMYIQGLKKLREKPVIWTAHNLVSHDTPNADREHYMIQKLINQCRGVMVLSDASRQLLLADYRIPEHVDIKKIYHGHYIDCYANQIAREDARKKLGIALNEFVYLVPGTIKPYKGHLEAIAAFKSISTECDTLLIAGGGDTSFINKLRELAERNAINVNGKIKFIPGFIADDEFQTLYNASDVTLLPFRHVLNSGSLLLAMSFGSPVIAPKTGSIPEIAMPQYYFGYEPNKNVVDGLKRALVEAKSAISDGLPSLEISDAIISYTRSKYDWQKIGTQLHAWYHKLV